MTSTAFLSAASAAIVSASCSGVIGRAFPVRCDRQRRRGRGSGSGGRRRPGGGSPTTRCRCAACRRTPASPMPANASSRRSATSARPAPARSATASVASSSTASGSCHVGRPRAMSPPRMKVSWSSGSRSCSSLQGIDRVRRSPARDLEVADARGDRRPPIGEPAELEALLRAGVLLRASLCGGSATGVSRTRSSPSCAAASDAHTRCADVRRVERAAEDADAGHAAALTGARGRRRRPRT